jgi:hypothetical protein
MAVRGTGITAMVKKNAGRCTATEFWWHILLGGYGRQVIAEWGAMSFRPVVRHHSYLTCNKITRSRGHQGGALAVDKHTLNLIFGRI